MFPQVLSFFNGEYGAKTPNILRATSASSVSSNILRDEVASSCLANYECSVFLLLDWLPTMAEDQNLNYS